MEIDLYLEPDEGDDEPAAICKRLIETEEQFDELKQFEPRIEILMRRNIEVKSGRMVLGSLNLPGVQGKLKPLFDWLLMSRYGYMPDYLMILCNHYWESVGPREREILVYHELCHAEPRRTKDGDLSMDDDTGEIRWGLCGHDVEEFTAVVRRYGAWNADIKSFVEAAKTRTT